MLAHLFAHIQHIPQLDMVRPWSACAWLVICAVGTLNILLWLFSGLVNLAIELTYRLLLLTDLKRQLLQFCFDRRACRCGAVRPVPWECKLTGFRLRLRRLLLDRGRNP